MTIDIEWKDERWAEIPEPMKEVAVYHLQSHFDEQSIADLKKVYEAVSALIKK